MATKIKNPNSNAPAYTTTRDEEGRALYVSTVGPDRDKAPVDTEVLVECAGPIETRSLVVFDRQAHGGIVGIEVLHPQHFEQAERDGRHSIEITVGQTDEQLVTVVDDLTLAGSPTGGRYPGLEADYSPQGQLVAIRVENTELRTHDS